MKQDTACNEDDNSYQQDEQHLATQLSLLCMHLMPLMINVLTRYA
jgi:hypothetical protein